MLKIHLIGTKHRPIICQGSCQSIIVDIHVNLTFTSKSVEVHNIRQTYLHIINDRTMPYYPIDSISSILSYLHMTQYLPQFEKHGFVTPLIFTLIDEEDLISMGILKYGHRKSLLLYQKIVKDSMKNNICNRSQLTTVPSTLVSSV